jgi:hypothetical protein
MVQSCQRGEVYKCSVPTISSSTITTTTPLIETVTHTFSPPLIVVSLLFNMKFNAIAFIVSALSAIGMARSGPCYNQ